MYNWQHKDWPNYSYNEQIINEYALQFAELSGVATGIFNTLDSEKQQNEVIGIIISEALKTSAIEGEMLSREDLMSSIRNRLGLNATLINVRDKRAENVALLMLQVRDNYAEQLSEQTIKGWHETLFSGARYVNAGVYRSGAELMQIVSGAFGKEVVHYEAPPSEQVEQEMQQFEGGMTSRKYISIAKTTRATATRDLKELVQLDIMSQHGDGRSTHYILKS